MNIVCPSRFKDIRSYPSTITDHCLTKQHVKEARYFEFECSICRLLVSGPLESGLIHIRSHFVDGKGASQALLPNEFSRRADLEQ